MNNAGATLSALGTAALMASLVAGCTASAADSADEERASGGEQTVEATQAFQSGITGELRAYGGRCLDLQDDGLGNQVQIYNCAGGSNQEWDLTTDPEFYVAPSAPSNGALMERYDGQGAGVTVAQWVQNQPSQLWTMPSVQISSGSNSSLCLSPGGTNYDGQVIVTPCTEAAEWTYDQSNAPWPLQTAGGLCPTASGTGKSGSTLFMEPCGSQPNQDWILVKGGTIRQGNLCADIRGGGGAGTVVQVFDCNGGSNQSWALNGQLVSVESGLCVSLPTYDGTPDTNNATAVEMSTCSNAAWQTWSYHF